jgi:hypothetical protein
MSDVHVVRRLLGVRALASRGLRTCRTDVSTRRLIIAALLCGLAILVAFAVQVLISA